MHSFYNCSLYLYLCLVMVFVILFFPYCSFSNITIIAWQIICPFVLDQFYWAEKMFWLGVAPEPLRRNHLVPENISETSIRAAANVLSQAIHDALSPRIKERALEIGKRISPEVMAANCDTFFLSIHLIKAKKY